MFAERRPQGPQEPIISYILVVSALVLYHHTNIIIPVQHYAIILVSLQHYSIIEPGEALQRGVVRVHPVDDALLGGPVLPVLV